MLFSQDTDLLASNDFSSVRTVPFSVATHPLQAGLSTFDQHFILYSEKSVLLAINSTSSGRTVSCLPTT
jgi:hypothetical protein